MELYIGDTVVTAADLGFNVHVQVTCVINARKVCCHFGELTRLDVAHVNLEQDVVPFRVGAEGNIVLAVVDIGTGMPIQSRADHLIGQRAKLGEVNISQINPAAAAGGLELDEGSLGEIGEGLADDGVGAHIGQRHQLLLRKATVRQGGLGLRLHGIGLGLGGIGLHGIGLGLGGVGIVGRLIREFQVGNVVLVTRGAIEVDIHGAAVIGIQGNGLNEDLHAVAYRGHHVRLGYDLRARKILTNTNGMSIGVIVHPVLVLTRHLKRNGGNVRQIQVANVNAAKLRELDVDVRGALRAFTNGDGAVLFAAVIRRDDQLVLEGGIRGLVNIGVLGLGRRGIARHGQLCVSRRLVAPRTDELAAAGNQDLLGVIRSLNGQADVMEGIEPVAVIGLGIAGVEYNGSLYRVVVGERGIIHTVMSGRYHVTLQEIAVGIHHELTSLAHNIRRKQNVIIILVQAGHNGGVIGKSQIAGILIQILGRAKELHLQIAEGKLHTRVSKGDLGILEALDGLGENIGQVALLITRVQIGEHVLIQGSHDDILHDHATAVLGILGKALENAVVVAVRMGKDPRTNDGLTLAGVILGQVVV